MVIWDKATSLQHVDGIVIIFFSWVILFGGKMRSGILELPGLTSLSVMTGQYCRYFGWKSLQGGTIPGKHNVTRLDYD